jgi:hypothetical protein
LLSSLFYSVLDFLPTVAADSMKDYACNPPVRRPIDNIRLAEKIKSWLAMEASIMSTT